ncbi:MAG TPA: c-type cytochrome [Bryobacteraceae bacterium]|jgi:putative heme-binding domain-containing protein
MRRNIARAGVFLVSAFACLSPAGLLAQQHGTDPVQLDTGARIYSGTCSVCHGPDGDQVSGVELKKGQFRHAANDDELAHVIQNGIPGTAMPPNNIGSGNLVALVAYLHAMHDFKTKKVALGDARSGRAIFEGKGGCVSCHRVNGKGSYIALDLSDVGSVRTPSYLEDAILDPNSADLPQHRFIRAVTRSGAVVTGRRINEDTLTVQIMDSKEHLISLNKQDLKEYAIDKEPRMPSYRDKLTAGERADLIAYMVSLKGPANGGGFGGGRGRGGRGQ